MEMFFRSAYYEVVTAMGMIRRMYAALSQYGSLPDELDADMKQKPSSDLAMSFS